MEICDLGIVVFVQLCGQFLPAQPIPGECHDLVLVEIFAFDGRELLQKCCDLSFFYHLYDRSSLLRGRNMRFLYTV